jgi:hypothetical protein
MMKSSYWMRLQWEMMMADLTEKAYDALDELYTNDPPKVNASKRGGIFTRQRELLKTLDDVSANYIQTRAETTNKLPSQVIGELVRKELASA